MRRAFFAKFSTEPHLDASFPVPPERPIDEERIEGSFPSLTSAWDLLAGDQVIRQVFRPDADRVDHPYVGQLAFLAQAVHGSVADTELLSNLGDPEQAPAPAVKNGQVDGRGRRRHARRGSRRDRGPRRSYPRGSRNPSLFGSGSIDVLGSKSGSKILGIFCKRLGWLDWLPSALCDLFALLRTVRTVYDGAHPVSGTVVKEFESFLSVLIHPFSFFFLPEEGRAQPPGG
jgi:hypothetical protein